jgi:hypothetical protein
MRSSLYYLLLKILQKKKRHAQGVPLILFPTPPRQPGAAQLLSAENPLFP